ncbi:MAG: hypothetical protein H5U08_00245 [Thermogutta sp.]|uniref:anti-sigma factor family protein n=1 Tax=Thermogutta sp. TaxID=1962930 RepID=UPI0019ACE9FF|nr:hypothetical protein [Thermogutta sp.]MBC7350764.1 hypothetical protein [Thermogutta sp.]
MLRCREISQLVSEAMDRKLPLRQRWAVWMHLMMCGLCAGFARDLRLLRRALRSHPERLISNADQLDVTLSEQARERIKAALRDAADEHP